jgi:hypothetical protein
MIPGIVILSDDTIKRALDRSLDIGQRMKYFLSTGNITSDNGLDLMQVSNIVAA